MGSAHSPTDAYDRLSQRNHGRGWGRRAAASGLALLIALAGACVVQNGKPQPGSGSGALDVVLETDMSLPKDFDHVTLQVTQGSSSLLSADTDVGPGGLLLPATFEVKSTPNASPVNIHAVAFKNHAPVVERDAITPIPTDHVGALHLALNYLCLGTAQQDADGGVGSTCPDALTCVLGECTTPQVPPSALVTVTPSSSPGADASADAGGAGGGCFDVATCFGSAMPATVDMASCTVTLPTGANAATVNIGLQFPLGGAGICGMNACWVSLTGWTATGSQAVLPTSACKQAASQGATIVVTTSCNTQGADMPPCGAWSSVSMPATQPMMGPLGMSSCTPPGTQSCGQCGTQSRTCNNGVWGPWNACMGEGPCAPGTTQSCGTGGTQTCGMTCQWGGCTCDSAQLTCGASGTCASPTDARTCGTCGNDCTALPHVVASGSGCASGKCSYTCVSGFADCKATGAGCSTDLTGPAACGSCTNDCTNLPHVSGPTSCGAAHCSFPSSSCAPGYGDCNGDPTDGCETALNDASHCGSCSTTCTSPSPTCDSSSGAPFCSPTCKGTVCGGACVDVNSSDTNCGSCGNACPAPTHGQSACTAGKCGITCNSGYAACSGSCVDTTSDAGNCGSCGHACPSGSSCQAGKCTCPGPTSQACGNCGTQTQICNDGVSSWSACANQGLCPPGATQACNGTGLETCSNACAWSSCACSSGFTICGNACVNEQNDVNNCGGCTKPCPAQNDTPGCSGGMCTVGTCNAGFMDCNGSATDGCEVNTAGDPANCGGCAKACMVLNDTPACSGGMCTVGMCSAGFTDCNGSATDGCEVNTAGDPANCGGCGKACMVLNDTPACSGGMCAVGTCNAGFTDCNGSATDGCEVNTAGDPANCGGCGKACMAQNDTPGCSGGMCTVGTCNAGFTDCNDSATDGCEVNTAGDPANCGGCGKACTVENNTPGCSGGTCTVGTCNPGFLDCNGNPGDGCEANPSTDPNNCGKCGNVCGGTVSCQNGACAVPSVLVTNAFQPKGLAVDGTNVYWADTNAAHTYPYTTALNFGVSPTDPSGVIMEQPLNGNAQSQIMIAWDEGAPVDVAVDGDGFVYWTLLNGNGGQIMRAPIVAAGGQPGVVPTTIATAAAPSEIALSGNNVYWLDGNAIFSIAKTATTSTASPTQVTPNSGGAGFAVDGTNLYWTEGLGIMGPGYVWQEPIGQTTPTLIAGGMNANPILTNPFGIAVNGQNVYWTDFSTGMGEGNVYSVPIGGGTVATVVSGRQDPATLVIDSTNVYWTEVPTSAIMTAPIGGGTATTLATFNPALNLASDFTNAAIGLRVDATHVYWSVDSPGADAGAPSGAIMQVVK